MFLETRRQMQVNYENAEGAGSVIAERLLMSVGRRPVTKGFGLENLNLDKTARGNIWVDGQMQTSVPGGICLRGFNRIFFTGPYCGARGGSGGTCRAGEERLHELQGAIPGVVYTNPEIAGVGDTEEALRKKGYSLSCRQTAYGLFRSILSRRMKGH